MMDYLFQVFEQRLTETLEQSVYAELGPEDRSLILRSLDLAIEAPSLVQGARELLVVLDDRPDLLQLPAAENG